MAFVLVKVWSAYMRQANAGQGSDDVDLIRQYAGVALEQAAYILEEVVELIVYLCLSEMSSSCQQSHRLFGFNIVLRKPTQT